MRWVGYFFLFIFILMLAAGGYAAKYVYDSYRELEQVSADLGGEFRWDLSSVIYDARGEKLYTLVPGSGENRTFTPLKQIPKPVQDAFVAIEDARFWNHKGIDPYRIMGAAWADVKYFLTGEGNLQGASTITQQLARNQFLNFDQTVNRKVKEMLLALKLERVYSKQEILEKYLNEVSFGGNNYGIYAAAQYYFGKTPDQLTLAEGAMLAGILPAPNALNPYVDYEAAKSRQEIVLDQMVYWGFIDQATAEQAKAQKLSFPGQRQVVKVEEQPIDFTGAHYVDYVINVLTTPGLAEQYGIQPFDDEELYRGGYKIYTAMDPHLQRLAEESLQKVMQEQASRWPELLMDPEHPEEWIQGAMVVKDPKTGRILAMVGGRTHQAMRELNRATDVFRQPGSTFKPIAVYTPAIELLGYGPGTVIDDAPFKWDEEKKALWPEDFEKNYVGLMPLWQAVAHSRNAAAVNVMAKVGVDRAAAIAKALGIRNLVETGPYNDMNLAMGLGGLTKGVTLLEMTDAYATIANLGLRIDPVVITKIVDRNGTVIYEAKPRRQQVIKESSAYLMIDAMKHTIRSGTAYGRTGGFHGWPAAGKTGTTEENVDAWFMGITSDLAVGVWNGYDNRDQPRYLPYTGAFVPVMIWNEFMNQVYKEENPPADWPRPKTVVDVEICADTGLLPSPLCPKTTMARFAAEAQPTQYDVDYWQVAWAIQETVTRPNGKTATVWKLWQPGCAGRPEQKIFLVRPPYPKHPEDPYNPRYVPQDVARSLPEESCTPVYGAGTPEPNAPGAGTMPGSPGLPPDSTQPGTPPDATQPGTQPGSPPGSDSGTPPAGDSNTGGDQSGHTPPPWLNLPPITVPGTGN